MKLVGSNVWSRVFELKFDVRAGDNRCIASVQMKVVPRHVAKAEARTL